MSVPNRFLIVDDEQSIRRLLRINFESQDCIVFEASTGSDAIKQAKETELNLIVLDLGLPDKDGFEVLKELRTFSKVPIIVLTVRDREQDKVMGLDLGADDYLVKPFSVPELKARIRVALRHSSNMPNELIYAVGPVKIDTSQKKVWVEDREIHLSSIEFQLLNSLARRGGKIIPAKILLTEIWGPKAEENSHYLRIYVGHLRKKIPITQFIVTEPGVGYRIQFHEEDSV